MPKVVSGRTLRSTTTQVNKSASIMNGGCSPIQTRNICIGYHVGHVQVHPTCHISLYMYAINKKREQGFGVLRGHDTTTIPHIVSKEEPHYVFPLFFPLYSTWPHVHFLKGSNERKKNVPNFKPFPSMITM